MMDTGEITGIVLCGGRSSRMGREKGLCLLQGKPLVAYAIELIQPFCNTIILSAHHDAYKRLDYRIVSDMYPGIGPLGGLYSSLSASGTSSNLVIACDMPLVPPGLISEMINQAEGYDAVVPRYQGRAEPLCACYKKKLTEVFEESIRQKKYGLQEIISGMQVHMIDIVPAMPFYRDDIFLNVNSMDQLKAIENKLR